MRGNKKRQDMVKMIRKEKAIMNKIKHDNIRGKWQGRNVIAEAQ